MLFMISWMLAGLSLFLAVWFLVRPWVLPRAAGPAPRRRLLALAWPWVQVAGRAFDPFIPVFLRQYLEKQIVLAGLDPVWKCQHVVALQCLSAGLAAAACAAVLYGVFAVPAAHAAALSVTIAMPFAWLPLQRLLELGRQRQAHILREFPFMLDMTVLCVEAGLNLQGALQQAAHHGPEGPLRAELRHVLADVRAGVAREHALAQMAMRTDLAPIRAFVTLVDQAGRMGMNLAPLLRVQADQQRAERFLRAEKKAMEAPVKLLFPLVFCVFPGTFIIISFPVVSRLLDAGF
ncbi:type II secretion system F family protein [Allopusillimonas ginsengisoli]|nr:type II secretion system F family protein [Allopusillimonas ginsengisoli]